RPARGDSGSGRTAGAGGAGRQSLPLHRLSEHRPGGAGRCARHAARCGACRGTGRRRNSGAARRHLRRGWSVMTSTMEPSAGHGADGEVGRSRLRKEDARLITGRTRWTDNISLPGMMYMAVLRSPVAHARSTSIDTSEARRMPGVEAVFTGADFADSQGSLPNAWPVTEDMKAPNAPALAVDQVNFAGEAVAVVIARSDYEAHDAIEGIDVDCEDLPVVLDMVQSVVDDADVVHSDLGTNRSATW